METSRIVAVVSAVVAVRPGQVVNSSVRAPERRPLFYFPATREGQTCHRECSEFICGVGGKTLAGLRSVRPLPAEAQAGGGRADRSRAGCF